MQCTYWPTWEKFLARWGLRSLACAFIKNARPLIPLMAQLMVLGLPLIRGIPLGDHYTALLGMLEDDVSTRLFAEYIKDGQQ